MGSGSRGGQGVLDRVDGAVVLLVVGGGPQDAGDTLSYLLSVLMRIPPPPGGTMFSCVGPVCVRPVSVLF